MPPLEGLWWQKNTQGLDYARKADMHFNLYDPAAGFRNEEDFEWAVQEATKKKKQDFSKVEFFLMTKDYVFSVCTSALMTMSLHC